MNLLIKGLYALAGATVVGFAVYEIKESKRITKELEEIKELDKELDDLLNKLKI